MGVSSSKPHPIETKWFPEFETTLPSLEGKTVAITGTTSGTGFIVARTAIRKNAEHVLLLNRSSERSKASEQSLQDEARKVQSSSHVETIPCDLQDFASVRDAAQTIRSKYDKVHVLCNNAGIMAMEDKATKDGYDVQMQTNHLSHFLLTQQLYPLLKKAAETSGQPSRVANHSSGARNLPGTPAKVEYYGKNGGNLGGNSSSMLFGGARWERYHQTKLANLVFTNAFNERIAGSNNTSPKVWATCAEPGLSSTALQVTTARNGGMGSGMWFMRFAQSAEDGSMPILSACFSPEQETSKTTIWHPSKGMVGPAKQSPMSPKEVASKEGANDLLWTASEEACGKFDPATE
mmetsp:Transcript_12346/g.27229  ORF Transcript_12346/g.27229 Transcript_12346/m.27229 type:complete len:349 (-) Transcript_12346:1252-2298(-)